MVKADQVFRQDFKSGCPKFSKVYDFTLQEGLTTKFKHEVYFCSFECKCI